MRGHSSAEERCGPHVAISPVMLWSSNGAVLKVIAPYIWMKVFAWSQVSSRAQGYVWCALFCAAPVLLLLCPVLPCPRPCVYALSTANSAPPDLSNFRMPRARWARARWARAALRSCFQLQVRYIIT